MQVDWHCHSRWSDGQGTAEQLAAQAAARGVTLGISDHALQDNHRLRQPEHLAAYLDDLRRAPVLRGVEISVGDVYPPAGLLDDFEYVIASMHGVRVPEGVVQSPRYLNYRAGLYPVYRPTVSRYRRHGYFDAWLRALEVTFRHWPVTVLGHFCLLPELANETRTFILDDDPQPDAAAADWLEGTIDLCLRYDVAIELNSKSRVPHAAFVARAVERGARFSLGSDAHQRRRAGDLSYGHRLVEQLGIPSNRLLGVADVRREGAAGASVPVGEPETVA
jgi:histidinol phosphatase-like PHP family hydrolase